MFLPTSGSRQSPARAAWPPVDYVSMTRALLIVDVQNDFCPGGSLGTDRGDEVAGRIAELAVERAPGSEGGYAEILATQDWHIDPGSHFSDNPDYVDSWPVHCVADSEGAALRAPLAPVRIDRAFRKGEHDAAYSGFEGADPSGTPLASYLREHAIDSLDVCGIATDYCVRATVLDALREGFQVRVLAELCSPVDAARGNAALDEMRAAGAEVA